MISILNKKDSLTMSGSFLAVRLPVGAISCPLMPMQLIEIIASH